jgi:hypothetical protein
MRTACAPTCATSSSSTSLTRTRSSSSTRPGTSSTATRPWLSNAQYTGTAGRIENAQVAVYLTYASPLAAFVRVAGIRWTVEDDFQNSKELAALDEHQVRRWTSWQRWTLLAMLAYAFLAITTADAHDTTPADTLIPLTVNEVRHLLVHVAMPRPTPAASFILGWSAWRRRHQARAQVSHYRRQAKALQLN